VQCILVNFGDGCSIGLSRAVALQVQQCNAAVGFVPVVDSYLLDVT